MRRPRSQRERNKTILVASSDPSLLQWKKQVLEHAGFAVIAASSIDQVSRTCQKQKIDLLILGSSLAPSEKRGFWVEARRTCRSPVLELYGDADPELMDESRTHAHPLSHTSSDLVDAVRTILDPKNH